MMVAAIMPSVTWVRYGRRYPSSRATTAVCRPATSACASRIGRATASAYSRSGSAAGTPRPASSSSSTKRMFSKARRWRWVYRSTASAVTPPISVSVVAESPGASVTWVTRTRE